MLYFTKPPEKSHYKSSWAEGGRASRKLCAEVTVLAASGMGTLSLIYIFWGIDANFVFRYGGIGILCVLGPAEHIVCVGSCGAVMEVPREMQCVYGKSIALSTISRSDT
jgi:hypothetical protein